MEKTNRYVLSDNCTIDLGRGTILSDESAYRMSKLDIRFLSYFLRNLNTGLTLDQILTEVWGQKYYEALESETKEIRDIEQWVRDEVNKLRHRVPELQTLLETADEGYRLISRNPSGVGAEMPTAVLPRTLTSSMGAFISEEHVLHREKEIGELRAQLLAGKCALLLSGMGGMGKTVIAKAVFFQIEKQFDHIGWINYRGDLQSSMMSDLAVADEIEDAQRRWRVISGLLRNSKKQILLVIDNVDVDVSANQDPMKDTLLQEVSGWPKVTVLLTSRLTELQGYTTYHLEQLSPDACEDLFCYYCPLTKGGEKPDKAEALEAVRSLVRYAGYHSFAIELLARSAKYAASLEGYAVDIKESGFQFPTLAVQSRYHNLYGDAAYQLRKLFNLRTRSQLEQQILWDFSVLPYMDLSLQEVGRWLGYTVNDLDRLLSEGWLLYRPGCVSMHPLAHETFYDVFSNEKAPAGTADAFVRCIESGSFFDEADSLSFRMRKYGIADHTIRQLELPKDAQLAFVQMQLGCSAQILGKVGAAIEHFQAALAIYQGLTDGHDYSEELALAHQELGYQLSYMKSGFSEASAHLWKALSLWRDAAGRKSREEEIAACCDYLGYLLSGDIKTFEEADNLLVEALQIRTKLFGDAPVSKQHDLAWTYDNYGYLLTRCKERHTEARRYLDLALQIRKALAIENQEKYATEVAWTYSNLANLFMAMGQKHTSESMFMSALSMLQNVETTFPGICTPDLAICYNNLACLLCDESQRHSEVESLLLNAYSTMQTSVKEFPGIYTGEYAAICNNLAVCAAQGSVSSADPLQFMSKAISVLTESPSQNEFEDELHAMELNLQTMKSEGNTSGGDGDDAAREFILFTLSGARIIGERRALRLNSQKTIGSP